MALLLAFGFGAFLWIAAFHGVFWPAFGFVAVCSLILLWAASSDRVRELQREDRP